MVDLAKAGVPKTIGPKPIVFTVIGLMAAYVIYHNEYFLINAAAPIWKHYEPFKWYLLGHGLAGGCALVLAPMQFSDRLRRRYLTLHRTTGAFYVAGAMILAPLGIIIQYFDEAQGADRSFTVETVIQGSLLFTTTLIGLVFALRRRIDQHRQWMIRSYAAALTFLEIRVILGIFGLDNPFDWRTVETVVWSCTASAILVGDIANLVYDARTGRFGRARRAAG
ncbi:MAG TPA: DUF2306 domain-containing protein [Stellaceae bacterium]|nr:DUF2306 domain-containing protein [Stellaceae bacterium]